MAAFRIEVVLCLATLTLQNALFALLVRYVSTRPGPKFQASTAVLNTEVLKLLLCLIIVYFWESRGFSHLLEQLKAKVVDQPVDTLKVCVPSLLYVLQNNLLYFAASHLDAATYQVTYQLKILTTAVFSVVLLRRKLLSTQWLSLVILLFGVILVQLAQKAPDVGTEKNLARVAAAVENKSNHQNQLMGILAVIVACCLSGYGGVYFEKILKSSNDMSIFIRNTQLSLCSIPFAFVTYVLYENQDPKTETASYLYGYDSLVWCLVILQAAGGLIVAAVVKWADNLLKGFATSIAIVLTCIISIILFDFHLTMQFSFGTFLVLASVFLYNYKPEEPRQEPLQLELKQHLLEVEEV